MGAGLQRERRAGIALIAEIVSVGTELLLGEIVDTNAAWIARKLADIGVDVFHRMTVGDNLARMQAVLQTALGRADVVIISGGLGPTQDDCTREAIAAVTGRPLEADAAAEATLRALFAHRGFTLTANNLKQATVPRGGTLLPNVAGTAPGVLVEHEGRTLIAVPGPPSEMQEMMVRSVLPYLEQRAGAGRLFARRLRLTGIGESAVADAIADIIEGSMDPTVAPYASPGEVTLRLATKGTDEVAATAKLDATEALIRERLPGNVYGRDEETMEVSVGIELRARRQTLAVAESCTGGLIASRVTDVPGASEYFLEGLVVYSNAAKERLLGVPAELLAAHGAVSEPVARAMAENVRTRAGADYGLATTGIAGPSGGTPEKPVGLVYVAVASARGTVCQQHTWPGTREQFKRRVSQMALSALREAILAGEAGDG